jgi:hypothetical protein
VVTSLQVLEGNFVYFLMSPTRLRVCVFHLDLVKSTNYEVPHYVIVSILLLLPPSGVQMLSSALCSQTPTVGVRFEDDRALKCSTAILIFTFLEDEK